MGQEMGIYEGGSVGGVAEVSALLCAISYVILQPTRLKLQHLQNTEQIRTNTSFTDGKCFISGID